MREQKYRITLSLPTRCCVLMTQLPGPVSAEHSLCAGLAARLCEAIAGRGINLVLSATARGEEGIVVFIPDDEASAETVLQDADIQYTMRPALTIPMANQPGAGAATFRELAGVGVNVDLLLPVRVSDDLFFAVICVDAAGKARRALGDLRPSHPVAVSDPRSHSRCYGHPRDLGSSAASWTPRRHEDICERNGKLDRTHCLAHTWESRQKG